MKLFVSVKTLANSTQVTRIDAQHFKVSVKEPPVDGKANEAVLRAVAEFLDVPFSQTSLVSGHTSKRKVIEIL